MRAITLHQPWASLVAIGEKHYETRSWSTAYRGPLAIHAAKTKKGRASSYQLITSTLTQAGYATFDHLPFGCVIALVNLNAVYSTLDVRLRYTTSEQELAFGDYSDDRFAWELELIRVYDPPIPATGRQGFWNWTVPA
jgi:hypothetical protein